MDYKRIDGVLYVIESKYAKALEVIGSQQHTINLLNDIDINDISLKSKKEKEKLDFAKKEIKCLENQNYNNCKYIENNKNKISELEAHIEQLEEKVTELEIDLSGAHGELSHAHDEIDNLQLELKEAQCGD